MAYAELEDIQAEFKGVTFSGSTHVTDDEVSAFIVQTDALINAYVSKRYLTPVSNTTDGFQFLKMICSGIVSERVRAILEVKQATNKEGNQNPKRPYDLSNATKLLKDIANGTLPLAGATVLSAGSGLYSENSANDIQPEFRKNSAQW